MTGIVGELWRPIPGWEGSYEVSDQGRVRSLDRWVVNVLGHKRFFRGLLLTPGAGSHGYLEVTLSRPSHNSDRLVHRLVMLAFVGPCPARHEVAHGNGCPTDNRLANLRYDTRTGNSMDKFAHGSQPEGEGCPHAKLTADQALAIYRQRQQPYGFGRQTQRRLATEYGCSEGSIASIWRGKSWRSVTGAT